jgi:hypothetical protein
MTKDDRKRSAGDRERKRKVVGLIYGTPDEGEHRNGVQVDVEDTLAFIRLGIMLSYGSSWQQPSVSSVCRFNLQLKGV